MTNLSVNINKIATIRNASGGNTPDLLKIAEDGELFGAEGITVHPRPDERHIRYQDVLNLKPLIKTELNIKGYPDEKFIQLILTVKPTQVTLVPEMAEVTVQKNGWNVEQNFKRLSGWVDLFTSHGIRTSLFVGTDPENIRWAAKTGTDRVELYTGPYAEDFSKDAEKAVEPYVQAAQLAKSLGIGVNAAHGLSLGNLPFLSKHIPWLDEVSIGHALICNALYNGLKDTIARYKACLQP